MVSTNEYINEALSIAMHAMRAAKILPWEVAPEGLHSTGHVP
jgi:hypothetical protein